MDTGFIEQGLVMQQGLLPCRQVQRVQALARQPVWVRVQALARQPVWERVQELARQPVWVRGLA